MLSANKIYGILAIGLVCWMIADSSMDNGKIQQFRDIELDSIFSIVDKVLIDHEVSLEKDSLILDSLAHIASVMKFSAFDVDMIMSAMQDHETEAIETAIELATVDSTIYRYHYVDSVVIRKVVKEIIIYDTIHEPLVIFDTIQGTGWKRKNKKKKK